MAALAILRDPDEKKKKKRKTQKVKKKKKAKIAVGWSYDVKHWNHLQTGGTGMIEKVVSIQPEPAVVDSRQTKTKQETKGEKERLTFGFIIIIVARREGQIWSGLTHAARRKNYCIHA